MKEHKKKPMTLKEFQIAGGKAKLEKYGTEVFKEMGRKSGEARRAKKLDKESKIVPNPISTTSSKDPL